MQAHTTDLIQQVIRSFAYNFGEPKMRAVIKLPTHGPMKVQRLCLSAAASIGEFARQQLARDSTRGQYRLAIVELTVQRYRGDTVNHGEFTMIHQEKGA